MGAHPTSPLTGLGADGGCQWGRKALTCAEGDAHNHSPTCAEGCFPTDRLGEGPQNQTGRQGPALLPGVMLHAPSATFKNSKLPL